MAIELGALSAQERRDARDLASRLERTAPRVDVGLQRTGSLETALGASTIAPAQRADDRVHGGIQRVEELVGVAQLGAAEGARDQRGHDERGDAADRPVHEAQERHARHQYEGDERLDDRREREARLGRQEPGHDEGHRHREGDLPPSGPGDEQDDLGDEDADEHAHDRLGDPPRARVAHQPQARHRDRRREQRDRVPQHEVRENTPRSRRRRSARSPVATRARG